MSLKSFFLAAIKAKLDVIISQDLSYSVNNLGKFEFRILFFLKICNKRAYSFNRDLRVGSDVG